ncbi:MAG: Trm112 family protein [Candidatus Thorarchaeota archaeon]
MKQWLMELLACSAQDCRSNLDLEVFESHEIESEAEATEEIDEGLITCPKCGRWYPVIEGIACMLPDNLRLTGKQRIEETKFLERWKERLSPSILKQGRPFGLSS